jgi:site-specific recombinase XerD
VFDQLFETPLAVRRHLAGPLAKERLAFLSKLADRGVSRKTLRVYAQKLLVFIGTFALVRRPKRIITRDEINRKTGDRRLCSLATRWLCFLRRLEERPVPASPYAAKIKAFAVYMERARGLSPVTIRNRCWLLPRFLGRLGTRVGSLRQITANQIDEALREMVSEGGYARVTIQCWAGEVRAFFRYAEARGWCRQGLAACIRGPRLFAQSSLPTGPSWDEVRRLLALTEGDRPVDIRDRAILLLLAIYGLRAGEVNRLRLEDFNWERELFHDELRRLFQVIDADQRNWSLEPATMHVIILLLYGAGLRLREATNLTCADVDLRDGVLTMRNTKFGKTRLVPVSPQLGQALARYAARRRARHSGAPFFTTRTGAAVKPDTLQHNFRILCNRAGIRRTDGTQEQPRLHDLRHTFAVHRLTSWYRQGADVQRLLHHLSVYLGHVHIRHTQIYLKMTPELLHAAGQQFERYAGKGPCHA